MPPTAFNRRVILARRAKLNSPRDAPARRRQTRPAGRGERKSQGFYWPLYRPGEIAIPRPALPDMFSGPQGRMCKGDGHVAEW